MAKNKDVWVSGALEWVELGNKLGIRAKYFGHDWEEPTHIVPKKPENISVNMQRHARGETLRREDFPEACYVFDPKRFGQTKDFFYLGGFPAVKGRLAAVLAEADLGAGELVRIPVYEEDKKSEIPGPFYALNFVRRDGLFLPDASLHLKSIFSLARHGRDLWRSFAEANDEIAVSSAALEEGPDMWIDPRLSSKIFLSGTLVKAIRQAKIKEGYLRLLRCRIVD